MHSLTYAPPEGHSKDHDNPPCCNNMKNAQSVNCDGNICNEMIVFV